MNKNVVRKMIIAALDDEHGVNSKAYYKMKEICKENGWNDILDTVEETEGRWYLPENHGLKKGK